MKRWMQAIAIVGALAAGPAQAASGKVALIPAQVTRGAAGSGPVVTEALRESLTQQGFEVLSAGTVTSALRSRRLNLAKPLTAAHLSTLRQATGADYVVYPRVLSVGQGINADQYQANILVNVGGKSASSFVHTRQVGQVFAPKVRNAARAVINREEADEAAGKLLEGFYTKAGG